MNPPTTARTPVFDGLSRSIQSLADQGVAASLLLVAMLAVASRISWLDVPLIQSYNGWNIPVDLGWGAHSSGISYGLFSLGLAICCLARTVILPWRPLTRRTLSIMGVASVSIAFLFALQFLFVDFSLVDQLTRQESEYLATLSYLNYHLPAQLLVMHPFRVSDIGVWDRVRLLAQFINFGAFLPLIGGGICIGGVWLMPSHVAEDRSAGEQWERDSALRGRRFAQIGIVVVGLLAVIIVGRPLLGWAYEQFGEAALNAGQYGKALSDFEHAQAITPNLADALFFHQDRGEAQYMLGVRQNPDVGIYIASQNHATGDILQALQTEQTYALVFPHDAALQQSIVNTLEEISFGIAAPRITVADNETPVEQPTIAIKVANVDAALIYLDELVQSDPAGVYAHYVRGRILMTQQAYEPASQDFLAVVSLTKDREMASSGYTYLAFCAEGRGNLAGARLLLTKAESLDDGYFNTTAREAASGLH